MSGAHLHLILNHISLFALVIGVVALATSMKRKSTDLRIFAVVLFVVAGIFGWITVETGEAAEALVKTLGGDTESFIHQHELAAEWALRSSLFVAVLAIAMEWSIRKQAKWAGVLQWALLVFAIHGCTVFATTAFLGGQIRHTEIRSPAN